MRIVMFSINPLFPDRVMGGAPLQLQKVALFLGEQGHEVTILCTRSPNSSTPFNWHSNVRVLPRLPFKQPFPQPYATPAYNIANIIQEVAGHLATADRFYMHDGELLYPWVYQQVPTVFSLRDNVYPETMLGGFLFQGDALIAISEYSRQFYLHTFGRFLPGLEERLVVIHNGVDWSRFRPVATREILDLIPVDPERDYLLLHPHRPEPSKGLSQTIAVVDRLVNKFHINNLKVLLPRWLEDGLSPEVRDFYRQMRREIEVRGLRRHFLFHEWVPQGLMPQYYALGDVTLALGHFVESFGNTVYESLGCGTPAVAAHVSTHRELLPDDMLDKVLFDDADTAAALVADILVGQRRTPQRTIDYLHTHYPLERQVEGYAEVILGARRLGPLSYVYAPLTDETVYRLAPWCYRWAGGIYHDFLARHEPLVTLTSLLDAGSGFITAAAAAAAGLPAGQIARWYEKGYIVPVRTENREDSLLLHNKNGRLAGTANS